MAIMARRTGAGRAISGRGSQRSPCRGQTANRWRGLTAAAPRGFRSLGVASIAKETTRPPSPSRRFHYDQNRTMLLRLTSCGSDWRAGGGGRVSLSGVPTPYWLTFRCQHLFPESAGADGRAEQGICARQRLGAKGRTPFLPQLWFHGVLVRGICSGPYRHRLWCVR
jgi:hypothetical protein